MKAGGLRFCGREVGVALPGVGAGLKAGRVFKIEARGIRARLIFQVVVEEPGFDLGAELLADGLGVIEIAEMARAEESQEPCRQGPRTRKFWWLAS